MRLDVVAGSLIESLALRANMVPEPLFHTQIAFTMARAIMAAVEVGVFDALIDGEKALEQIAEKCKTQPKPTLSLLNAMLACGYLTNSPRKNYYRLKPVAKKWLTRSSPHSICDKIIFQNQEWDFLARLTPYLRDGKPLNLHAFETPEEWRLYQRGMVDIGKLALTEVVRRVPIPKNAASMLDIGGSGGTYSAAFVKSRAALTSMILDLPAAVVHAREMVKSHGLPPEKLSIRAGDVMEEDLGAGLYDFVFLGNVAHHLNDSQNRHLAKKIAAALKPGGVYCILDVARTGQASKKAQAGALLDLYFGLTSQSGTWSIPELASWIEAAGLKPAKPICLRTGPGLVMVYGTRQKYR